MLRFHVPLIEPDVRISRIRLPALSGAEGSDGFVTSTAAPIATGWSDQLPDGSDPR